MDAFVGLFASTVQITVDDAGIRCVSPQGAEWIAFALLRDVETGWNVFARPFFRLRFADGTVRVLRVGRDDVLDAQEAILRGLGRPEQSHDDESLVGALGRAGRPIVEWLASIAAWAHGSGDYRTSAVDHATLISCFSDATANVEIRAACVHAALTSHHEEDLVAIATTFVERALPPIVVVAARLGRGGAALVPDEMMEDALALLPLGERAALQQAMNAPSTHDDEHHVRELIANAASVLIAAKTPVHKLRRAHAMTLGGYADQQGVSRFK